MSSNKPFMTDAKRWIRMAGRVLLDTNMVIAVFRPEPAVVEKCRANKLYLSAIVLGELLYGAEKSSQRESNLQNLNRFIENCPTLPCDPRTSRIYAQVKARLANRGTPIPENDIWIAAAALQHGLVLATRDHHFRNVDGLQIEAW